MTFVVGWSRFPIAKFRTSLYCVRSRRTCSVAKILIVFGPDALFLFADVGPNFVHLHVLHLHVADVAAHDLFATFAREDQQFQNRAVVDAGHPLHAGDAVAFEKHFKNEFRFVYRQVHAVQRIVLKLQENLRALAALESLMTFRSRPSRLQLLRQLWQVILDLAFRRAVVQNGSGR